MGSLLLLKTSSFPKQKLEKGLPGLPVATPAVIQAIDTGKLAYLDALADPFLRDADISTTRERTR